MNVTFPALTVPRELICNDPFWRYPSRCLAGEGVAHLRVWETANGTPGQVGGTRLAVVTETGLGASITNSIQDIHAALTNAYGPRIVLLEHWPAGTGADPHEHLDQAVIINGEPGWRRIWPTPPTNPHHDQYDTWMNAHGHQLLATQTGA